MANLIRFSLQNLWIILWVVVAVPCFASPSARVGQNFTGSRFPTDSDAEPADANGAVGPNHFVEIINGRFAVYNKSDGRKVRSLADRNFWASAGVSIGSSLDITDPRLIFDADAQRWFTSCIDFSPAAPRQTGNRFLFAVSDSADPTGSWHGFAFTADPVHSDFADFPTLGVDAEAVYLAGDLYTTTLGLHVGSTLAILPKAGLLANPPNIDARTTLDPLAFNAHGQVLQPAVSVGQTQPGERVLAVANIGEDGKPHNSLLLSIVEGGAATNFVALQVPDYVAPSGLPQPDGTRNLDSGDARISAAVRQVGDVLYAVHSVTNSGRAAVRWYRIDTRQMTLLETGLISDPNLDLSYPSVAANVYGTVVVACNGSSLQSFVGCFAVPGQVINGSLQFGGLLLLKAGLASYKSTDTTGLKRWGDFSTTTVDPNDPSRFWTIQLYPTSTTAWATQITELLTPVALSVVVTVSGLEISWPATAASAQLQFAPSLPALNGWAPVSQSPVVTGDRAVVTVPLAGEAGYFRLSQ